MAKESYEFADLVAIKKLEQELTEREEKEATKIFKVCSKCGERKSIYKFSKDKRNTSGRTNTCKACRVVEASEYYLKNKERIIVRHRIYWSSHKGDRSIYHKEYQRKNKERLQKLASEWYQENKERIKVRSLKYYYANEAICNQKRKLWRENNKEKIREYNRQYKRTYI